MKIKTNFLARLKTLLYVCAKVLCAVRVLIFSSIKHKLCYCYKAKKKYVSNNNRV